jgi:hypothetical protein
LRSLGLAFDLDEIRLRQTRPGLADPRLPGPEVRQGEQSLAVVVEAAGRIYVRDREVVAQAAALVRRGELREHAERLI